jgi:hypothetical protein
VTTAAKAKKNPADADPLAMLERLSSLDLAPIDEEIAACEQRLAKLKFLRRNVAVARGEPARKARKDKGIRKTANGGNGGGAATSEAATDDATLAAKIEKYLNAAGRARVAVIAADTQVHHKTVERILRSDVRFHMQPEGMWVLRR